MVHCIERFVNGDINENLRAGLERVMLHWLTWNRMVEQVADFRYRVEDEFVPLVRLQIHPLSLSLSKLAPKFVRS